MVLKVTGYKELMENEPANKASIEKREDIIMPLFTLQQYAIQKKNLLNLEGNNSNDEINVLEKIITRTLFGNINASRNSA
jgi:phosphoenolpyruvate carboxylase